MIFSLGEIIDEHVQMAMISKFVIRKREAHDFIGIYFDGISKELMIISPLNVGKTHQVKIPSIIENK